MKTVGSGSSAVTTVFVYDAMGKLIAEYRSDSAQPPNGGGTSYLTTDHLGSTRVVTKQDKSVQARYDYLILTFYSDDADHSGNKDDLVVKGVVHYDRRSERWVAEINWNEIKHESEIRAD